MDYEKKYKEALEWARKVMQGKVGFVLDDVLEKFPELAESEDEKIRNEIITFLTYYHTGQGNSVEYNDDWIDWLEKQGEQKSVFEMITPEESLGIDSNTYNKIVDECIYGEQKPADDIERKYNPCYNMPFKKAQEYISNRGFDIPWTNCDVFVDFRYVTQTVANILRWADNNPKQKSAWSVEDETMFRKAIVTIDNVRMDTDFQEYYQGICDWLESLKDRVQPKQEWGEEDESNLQGIIDEIKANKNHAPAYDLATYNRFLSWLESLKDRVLPQPKQEWSEEDEDILNTIINHFKVNVECTDEDDIVRWLKSFKDRVQPKQEWSEEDEKMIEICVGALRYSCYSIPSVEKAVNWLKSLRLQNTWKPSEEQMEALNGINVTGGVSYAGQAQELRDLYNDLKKLREK